MPMTDERTSDSGGANGEAAWAQAGAAWADVIAYLEEDVLGPENADD